MAAMTRAVYASTTKLGYTLLKFKLLPGNEVCELKFQVHEHAHMCFTEFCWEMRKRGYINTHVIFINDVHFVVKFVKSG